MRKWIITLSAFATVIILLVVLLWTSSMPLYEGVKVNFESTGTKYVFRAYGADAQNMLEAAAIRTQSIDNLVQGHVSADVETLNKAAGGFVKVDPATLYLLYASVEYYKKTLNKFSVCDAKVREAYALPEGAQRQKAIKELEGVPGMEGLSVRFADSEAGIIEGMGLTLESLLGGYIVDQAAGIARDYKIKNACFTTEDVSYAIGSRPDGGWWTYEIPHPTLAGENLGVLLYKNQAVASAGSFMGQLEVNGKLLPAVIDPTTNAPADYGIQGVTVIASTAMDAAALSRALLCMSQSQGNALLLSFAGAEAVWVMEDQTVTWTKGLDDRFSLRLSDYTKK